LNIGDDAFDAEGNQVQYDLQAVTTQERKRHDCKATAKAKLAASDWSVLPDVQITNKLILTTIVLFCVVM
jgi:hypothetical protein